MTTRVFQNGNSQAVRIPQPFRLPGREVQIERDGDTLIIRPLTSASSLTHKYLGSMAPGSPDDTLLSLIEDAGIYYEE